MNLIELLFGRYGPVLGYKELAEVLNRDEKSLKNDYSSGKLPLPTFKIGRSRYVHVRDLAEFLDTQSESANESFQDEQAKLSY